MTAKRLKMESTSCPSGSFCLAVDTPPASADNMFITSKQVCSPWRILPASASKKSPAGEPLWLTQKAMAELFGVQTPAASKHLKNIFEEGELREEVVVSKMEIATPHGASEIGSSNVQKMQFATCKDFLQVQPPCPPRRKKGGVQ